MVHFRRMVAADVSFAMRLKNQAGWNQTEDDWRRFIMLAPSGCFVAEEAGRAVGTVAALVFDSIGWIAMVLVDESARHRGIGTRLVQHALSYLDARDVPTARLDATPLGRPIYEKLGFTAEYDLVRYGGVATAATAHEGIVSVGPEELDKVLELDRKATGTRRGGLIEALYGECPEAMRVYTAGQDIVGYLTLRPGSRRVQIGPGVALHPEAGCALLDDAITRCAGQPVFVDVPLVNRPAVAWAESGGLEIQRPLTRMRRGEPVADDPTQLWASSGPEKG